MSNFVFVWFCFCVDVWVLIVYRPPFCTAVQDDRLIRFLKEFIVGKDVNIVLENVGCTIYLFICSYLLAL